MKKSYLFFVIIILLLISLTVIGYIVKVGKSTPRNIFVNVFDLLYQKIEKEYIYNQNAIEGNIKFSSDTLKVIDDTKFFDLIMGNNYNLNFKADYKNKLAYLRVDSSYGDNKSTYFKKYYEDKNEYTFISDNTDNYVSNSMTQKEYDSLFNKLQIKKDYLTIIKGVESALINKNNEIYFLQNVDPVNKKIGNKKYNLYENVLIINNKNRLEIMKNVNNNLKNNKDFLKSYKSIYGKEYDILNHDKITDFINNNEINITIYTKQFGGEFVSIFATFIEGKKFRYIELYKENDEILFNTNIFDLDMNGMLKVEDKKGNISVNLLNYTNNKNYNINISYSFKYVDSIKKEDISNSINISTISSEKYAEIYKNVSDRQELNSFHKAYELYKVYEDPNYISRSIGFVL